MTKDQDAATLLYLQAAMRAAWEGEQATCGREWLVASAALVASRLALSAAERLEGR